MAELKTGFERIGFQAVRTHLNSGNVVFSACREEPTVLASRISAMIKERFALDIPVYVLKKRRWRRFWRVPLTGGGRKIRKSMTI